jgi:hypothetical protein
MLLFNVNISSLASSHEEHTRDEYLCPIDVSLYCNYCEISMLQWRPYYFECQSCFLNVFYSYAIDFDCDIYTW